MKIPWARPTYWGNESDYVNDALRSTWISGGAYVDRFEREFADYCAVPDAIAVANGTAALHLAYLALGFGPGDEIVVPGFGFLAAANMAMMVGATPVFADVDPLTWCVSPESIESCLSPRTRAIIAVHTYGNVCDTEGILSVVQNKRAIVIEDAAEAIGSKRSGRMAGSISGIGTFSFHATKTITTGEGGAVVTRDPELATSLRLYRGHGFASKRYWHHVAGHNFRLTNLQAALGCAQLEQVDRIVERRARIFANYKSRLHDFEGLSFQTFDPCVDPVVWAVAVLLDSNRFPQGRDQVVDQLASQGIETRPGFYTSNALGHLYGGAEIPVSDEVSRALLVLPSSPALTDNDVDLVCEALKSVAA